MSCSSMTPRCALPVITPARCGKELLPNPLRPPQYVDRVKRESNETGGDCGDGVSPFGLGAYDLALKGLGASLGLLESVVHGKVKNGYAVRRALPPSVCGPLTSPPRAAARPPCWTPRRAGPRPRVLHV